MLSNLLVLPQAAQKKILLSIILSSTLLSHTALATTNPDAYSPQDVLIGATPAIQASANNGAGITFGVIDTGIAAPWVGFQGRVNTAESTCIITGCSKKLAITDNNGHGTFVASEIIGNIPSVGMEGVDPAATAIAVKVLNAQGSGYASDLSTGITYAVNHGAQILNLSIGPTGNNAQNAAFYQSLAGAVNYAASRNVIVVFAGGNSSQAFNGGLNVTGFTNSAITHMMFMGSTNAGETLSSFSNTPGTGGFVSTTGKFYAYDNMWMMADGENIWGASNYHTAQLGYDYITQLSGTSMATPQAAGAAGLLAARWPFLIAQGTIPQILEETAQNLGATGANSTYGDGFLRVDLAMQPIGALTVTINGKKVAVSSSGIISSSALGNLGKLASSLSKAVAYDSYGRDFAVNLSGSILSKTSLGTSASTTQVMGQSGSNARHFASTDDDNSSWMAFSGSPGNTEPTHSATDDPSRSLPAEWSFASMNEGKYAGVGYGSGAPLSFNDARWGEPTTFFNNTSDMGGSLLGLVADGNFAVSGLRLTDSSLISIGMVRTNTDNLATTLENGQSAEGFAFGYTVEPSDSWKVSLTTSYLNEHNMLLGSVSEGVLGFGGTNTTQSVGIGSRINLGGNYQLGFDAIYAMTDKSADQNSLISNVSNLSSAAYNVSLTKANLTGNNDDIGISIGKPLRIYAGSAELDVPTGTDNTGNPITTRERTSLVPTGNETDLSLNYTRPIAEDITSGFSLSYRNDADNVAGVNDAAAMLHINIKF